MYEALMPGEFFGVMNAVLVNGTGTVYGSSIDTRKTRYIGLRIQATSVGGTPNLKVEWEVGISRPSTETAVNTNYVVPDNMATPFTTLADQLWHVVQVFPAPSSYGRVRITGNATNGTDSLVTAQVFIQG